jgi:hypothetical protein
MNNLDGIGGDEFGQKMRSKGSCGPNQRNGSHSSRAQLKMDVCWDCGIEGGESGFLKSPTAKISGVALPRKLTAATRDKREDDKGTFDILF